VEGKGPKRIDSGSMNMDNFCRRGEVYGDAASEEINLSRTNILSIKNCFVFVKGQKVILALIN